MLDGPLEFLSGYQDLAEDGVDASLARIETCSSNDGVLVVQEKPTAPVSISIDHNHVGGSIGSFGLLDPSLDVPVRAQANAFAILRMHLLQKTLQYLSAFSERRLGPFFLGSTGFCNNPVDSVARDRVDSSQGAASRR